MTYEPCAKWTPDCSGKQDYDGRLIDISTRYWPRGGGHFVVRNTAAGVTIEDGSARPEIRPSATASLLLRHGAPDEYGYGNYDTIMTCNFEADTECEVKAQVEAWVLAKVNEVASVLAAHFAPESKPASEPVYGTGACGGGAVDGVPVRVVCSLPTRDKAPCPACNGRGCKP